MHFERFDLAAGDWAAELGRFPEATLCQTPDWLEFLRRTQHGEAVAARLMDGASVVGTFTGMVTRAAGLRVLGSPFPGWTTPYMGFNLAPGVPRRDAFGVLAEYAWNELDCLHLELMDRHLSLADVADFGVKYRMFETSEVDLASGDSALVGSFSGTCRRYIRKAARDGLVAEEATDDAFVDEYYAQLVDVFARQKLTPTYSATRVHELFRTVPREHLLAMRTRLPDGRVAATAIFHAVDRRRAYFWGAASWQHLTPLHPNELLMAAAMSRLRERGFTILDLGGSGNYKQKYHPRPTPVPWVRLSKYRFIEDLRQAARLAVLARQRLRGRGRRRAVPPSTRG